MPHGVRHGLIIEAVRYGLDPDVGIDVPELPRCDLGFQLAGVLRAVQELTAEIRRIHGIEIA